MRLRALVAAWALAVVVTVVTTDPAETPPEEVIITAEASEPVIATIVTTTTSTTLPPTTSPPTTARRAPQPAPEPPRTVEASGDVWVRLAQCESGNRNVNTGNGYYGYFQFSASTWRSVGGSGLPHEHGWDEQLHRAQILQARSGWAQWPSCSRKLGLR